ncbi:MAG: tetratricopeptide repeat protein, partial [Actinomycetota bacterium]
MGGATCGSCFGAWETALDDFDRATRLAPEHATVWLDRGLARAMLGRRDAARADLDRAARVAPGDARIAAGRA